MIREFNMLICGVGGQGVIVISEILGKAAVSEGLRVRASETIGMAQRGAPVNAMIRLGSAPEGPLIPTGRGDLMLGLEPAEALRNITYMSKSSLILLNTRTIVPVMVLLGKSTYPSLEQIIEKLKENSARIVSLEAVNLAEEAGSLPSANMVMLGAACGTSLLPIKTDTVKTTLETSFTGKRRLTSIKAFDLGYQACQQALKGS